MGDQQLEPFWAETEIRLHFRDELRSARAAALKDSEGLMQILFALENLGAFLKGNRSETNNQGLGAYAGKLNAVAGMSHFASTVPQKCPHFHNQFKKIFDLLREARNIALHQGAYARHITTHAVEVALILEDSVMNGLDKLKHYMVRSPVCASPWHPISFVRQTMLLNSFSFLPVQLEEKDSDSWRLVSDVAVARYLRCADSQDGTDKLTVSLKDAYDNGKGKLRLDRPQHYEPDEEIEKFLTSPNSFPGLIVHDGNLLGIITPFDVL